jgi:hypothetical protein
MANFHVLSYESLPDFLLLQRPIYWEEVNTAAEEIRQKTADIFANNSRRHILFGRKLILLIQVSNRGFNLATVGSCPVLRNGSEFFISK